MMSYPSPTSSSATSLPKIAHGRSRLSAKKLWNDHSSIGIYNKVEKSRLHTPEEAPLPVSKNPKPLYRRKVTNPKPFRILHSDSNYGIRSTTSLPSLYAQMTFLSNAVRNNDGSTSYKGMCQKRRTQTVPSSAPGRLEAAGPRRKDFHWTSASNDKPMPRMLLPTSPGPNSNWFAWTSPRDTDSPPESPRKERNVRRSNIMRATRSESGIDHQSSFLHSIAEKRGQMVVAYKHNGKQHYTLVDPPEPSPSPIRVTKNSYTSGSSAISSSYAYTNSSKSGTEFSVRGVRRLDQNPSVKDVEIISTVDGAQDTTHTNASDERKQPSDDEGQEHEQVQHSQDTDNHTSQDNDTEVKETRSNKGVHFADSVHEESDNEKKASHSATPEDSSGLGTNEDSSSRIPSVDDTDSITSDSGTPTKSAVGNDDGDHNHSNPTPDNVSDDDKENGRNANILENTNLLEDSGAQSPLVEDNDTRPSITSAVDKNILHVEDNHSNHINNNAGDDNRETESDAKESDEGESHDLIDDNLVPSSDQENVTDDKPDTANTNVENEQKE